MPVLEFDETANLAAEAVMISGRTPPVHLEPIPELEFVQTLGVVNLRCVNGACGGAWGRVRYRRWQGAVRVVDC